MQSFKIEYGSSMWKDFTIETMNEKQKINIQWILISQLRV